MGRAFVVVLALGLSLLHPTMSAEKFELSHGQCAGWHAKAGPCIFIDHWMLAATKGSQSSSVECNFLLLQHSSLLGREEVTPSPSGGCSHGSGFVSNSGSEHRPPSSQSSPLTEVRLCPSALAQPSAPLGKCSRNSVAQLVERIFMFCRAWI